MRLTAVIAALALLIGCAERGDLSFQSPRDAAVPIDAGVLALRDAEISDANFDDEDAMKRGLLAGLVTLTLGAGVLLGDTLFDSSTNAAPEMSVLADVSGAQAAAIAITGSCTDDGQPTSPGAVAYLWNVDSDTGTTCVVAAPSSASTTVSSATAGTCSVTLTCCDVAFSGATCTAPGLSDSDTLVATIQTPFQILQAALGGDLVALWEVPATDDATISVISGRIDALNSLVGGNAQQAAAEANRPLYRTTTDGIEGEPCLEIDSSDRYMDAALTVAAANRAALYAVMRPTIVGSGNKVLVSTFSGTDDSTIGYGITTLQHRAKLAFTTAGEAQLAITSPAFSYQEWSLRAALPLATGALSQVDGVTTTPNFAVSETTRAIATARISGTTTVGAGQLKLYAIVTNITAAYDAAMRTYVAARWPLVGTPMASITFAGQSNAAYLVMADFVELPGYTREQSGFASMAISYWSKAGGGAGYTALLTTLQRNVATGLRPAVVWLQGEADSDTEVEADAYLAALELLRTNLETDLGQGSNYIYWVITRFHADFLANGAYPYASEVDGHLATFAANHSGHATTINPNLSGGSTIDNVHLGPNGGPTSVAQQYVMDAARAAVLASGINPRRKKKRRKLQWPGRRVAANDNGARLAA